MSHTHRLVEVLSDPGESWQLDLFLVRYRNNSLGSSGELVKGLVGVTSPLLSSGLLSEIMEGKGVGRRKGHTSDLPSFPHKAFF